MSITNLVADIAFIAFIIVHIFLIALMMWQYRKASKNAHPFLISMALYFIFEMIGVIFDYYLSYITELHTKLETNNLLMNNLALFYTIFTVIAPVYLIFILEKQLFKKPKIKEKHAITIFECVLLAILALFLWNSYTKAAALSQLGLLWLYFIIIFQVCFFIFSFLIVAIRSTGHYKRNALLVFLGKLGSFICTGVWGIIVYIVSQNPTRFSLDTLYLFLSVNYIFLTLSTLIMSYGLYQLYAN